MLQKTRDKLRITIMKKDLINESQWILKENFDNLPS